MKQYSGGKKKILEFLLLDLNWMIAEQQQCQLNENHAGVYNLLKIHSLRRRLLQFLHFSLKISRLKAEVDCIPVE